MGVCRPRIHAFDDSRLELIGPGDRFRQVPDDAAAERFPSRAGEISALASAGAPFVFFEKATFFGLAVGGVGQVVLVAERQIGSSATSVVRDLVIVGHLRASLPVIHSFSRAIAGVLKMAGPGGPEAIRRNPPSATSLAAQSACDPLERPIVEHLPSRAGEISALASAQAPIVFFDQVPFFGFNDGIGRVTLVVQRSMLTEAGGAVRSDFAAVAHLRGSSAAYRSLKAAVDGIILMGSPGPAGQAN